ncbi:MAG: SulP family inorganic anion transporter [Streptosporangiaceae bacterium]
MARTREDVLAALTGCAILVPEAIAYAGSAGVPPQYALASAPLALLGYALVGRSPRLLVGATAATGVYSASVVGAGARPPAEVVELSAALAGIETVCLD